MFRFLCRCRRDCFSKISEEQQLEIFQRLYCMSTKNEQDIFLSSLIEPQEIQRRRPRKESSVSKPNKFVYKYFVLVNCQRTEVCKKAFVSLLGDVSVKRLRRLQSCILQGKTPTDMRGVGNTNRALPNEDVLLLNEHISSFPVSVTHYSSRQYRYLPSELNCQKMYDLFRRKYPNTPITYKYYVNYFNTHFDLSFGPPQIDTCVKCEELMVKLKSPSLNVVAKRVAEAELQIHKRRSKKYFSKMKETREECQTNPELLGLCFDYCQNLPLPKIPIQDIFYMRQLWVYMFGVHNMKTNTSVLYTYHEGIARKGANEVCTFLLNYITEYVPHTVKELRLFSDGAAGQNKNHIMIRLCQALVDTKRFDKIQHYFPVRGHSFNACDRDFSIIKKATKKVDRIYDVKQYCELLLNAPKRPNKFTINLVETSDILNFVEWWPQMYKRGGISEESRSKAVAKTAKVRFQPASFMHFEYSSENPGTVTTRDFIDGLLHHTFSLKLKHTVTLTDKQAYEEPNRINDKKMEDLKKLRIYIPEEYTVFFNEILMWPTTCSGITDSV